MMNGEAADSQKRRAQLKSFSHATPCCISPRISVIVRFLMNASGSGWGIIDSTVTLLRSGLTSFTIQARRFLPSSRMFSKNRRDLALIIWT